MRRWGQCSTVVLALAAVLGIGDPVGAAPTGPRPTGPVRRTECAGCHQDGVPRQFYTRVENPENNSFLLAPLAIAAGGTQKCSQVVFQSKDDPDYQQILQTFMPIHQLLSQRPRADMPEFQLICD